MSKGGHHFTISKETKGFLSTVAPECKKPRNETVSVTPNEEVKLNCLVEANPPDVSTFCTFVTSFVYVWLYLLPGVYSFNVVSTNNQTLACP